MHIKSLVPPSDHILQQAKRSPRLNVNFRLLVLVVTKFWRFRDLRTRAKALVSIYYKYRTETRVNDFVN